MVDLYNYKSDEQGAWCVGNKSQKILLDVNEVEYESLNASKNFQHYLNNNYEKFSQSWTSVWIICLNLPATLSMIYNYI